MPGGLSPEIPTKVRRFVRPTDVPDTGLICDLSQVDPDKDVTGWAERLRCLVYLRTRCGDELSGEHDM